MVLSSLSHSGHYQTILQDSNFKGARNESASSTWLGDVVNQQCANSTPVISTRYRSVPLLTSGVPNCALIVLPSTCRNKQCHFAMTMAHVLLTNLHTSGRKLNANRWLRFRTEFISSKAGEKVRFPNTRVADQNHFEKVIITAVGQVIRTNARFWSQTNSSEATNLTRRYLLTSSQARRLPVSKSESEYLRAQFFNGCTMLEDDCLREWCLDIVVVTSSHHGLRRHSI